MRERLVSTTTQSSYELVSLIILGVSQGSNRSNQIPDVRDLRTASGTSPQSLAWNVAPRSFEHWTSISSTSQYLTGNLPHRANH